MSKKPTTLQLCYRNISVYYILHAKGTSTLAVGAESCRCTDYMKRNGSTFYMKLAQVLSVDKRFKQYDIDSRINKFWVVKKHKFSVRQVELGCQYFKQG